jgi:hypothetical protein
MQVPFKPTTQVHHNGHKEHEGKPEGVFALRADKTSCDFVFVVRFVVKNFGDNFGWGMKNPAARQERRARHRVMAKSIGRLIKRVKHERAGFQL